MDATKIHILAADTGNQAHVVRAAAEYFGNSSVTVTWVGNSAQVVDFLSSKPACDLIVLSVHGDQRGMLLPLVHEDFRHLSPYDGVIRPADFAEFLALDGGVILNHACMGGTPEMARGFLSGGADSYVGATDYPNAAASTKFVLDFLYSFLVQNPRDVELAHQAARNESDDRRLFKLYVR